MGTPTILGKITTVVAILFMITSFSLAKMSSRPASVVPASGPAPAAAPGAPAETAPSATPATPPAAPK
jgi:preprotein translocase subunit SecG